MRTNVNADFNQRYSSWGKLDTIGARLVKRTLLRQSAVIEEKDAS